MTSYIYSILMALLLFGYQISSAQITATQMGMYNFAVKQNLSSGEMDGTIDVTVKLQNAVNASRDAKQALFIPSGTYKVSAQILCIMTHEDPTDGRNNPDLGVNIVGSSTNRPTIVLADNTKAFNAGIPKAVFHYMVDPTLINPKKGKTYNTAWMMKGGIRGLNIDLGKGNANAVGIYWSSAQYNYIEDITIYAREGFAGLTGISGRNSLTANVKVIGGQYGMYFPSYSEAQLWGMPGAVQKTITGCTFTKQTVAPLSLTDWGGLTIIGTSIVTDTETAIEMKCNETVYVFSFSMIDSKIEFTSTRPSNIAIKNINQGLVTLRGVYILRAGIICDNGGDNNLLPQPNTTDWTVVKRYNYVYKTGKKVKYDNSLTFKALNYDAVTGVQSDSDIVSIGTVPAPPANLISQHIWGSTPSFEDTDAFLVTKAEDIQPAIDAHQKVCIARGTYKLTKPITLKSNTILFGCPGLGDAGTILQYGWTPSSPTWLVTTENNAAATTYMMDIATDPPAKDYHGGIHWQAGKNSIIRTIRTDISRDWKEKDMIRLYFSGNGGGRVFNYQDEIGSNPQNTNFRKVKISNTKQLLTFYGLNLERGGRDYEDSTFPMLEIENSSGIRIFGAKTEADQPYASINNSTDIFMTNIIDFSNAGVVDDDYIQITGSACDSIEITNAMFLKPANQQNLIVADPWNTNEVPRTMTLGCYHRNWSSVSNIDTVSTGFSNLFNDSIFKLYPNPATKTIKIEMTGTQRNNKIQLRNIYGELIKEVSVTSPYIEINIDCLSRGVYFVCLKNNRKISSKFIII